MRNSLVYLACLGLMISCDSPKEKANDKLTLPPTNRTVASGFDTNDIETFSYQNCEYIVYKSAQDANSMYGLMAHKGNCSNPIHLRKDTSQLK